MDKKISKLLMFVIIPLYQLQGTLYARGSAVSQTLLLLWLLIDVLYLLKCLKIKNLVNKPQKTLLILLGCNAFYWLISDKFVPYVNQPSYQDLKNISTVLLSSFPFLYFFHKELVIHEELKVFYLIMLIVSVLSYRTFSTELLNQYTWVERITNNMAYLFVSLIPLVGIFTNKKHLLILFLISLFFVLDSAKRGAIVCFLAVVCVYIFNFIQSAQHKQKLKYILLSFSFLSIVSLFAIKTYSQSELLQNRVMSMNNGEDTSGEARVNQYEKIWNYFINDNLFNAIFGNGFDASVSIAGNYAHNDWFELLANLGLIGVVIYFSYFVNSFLYFKKYKLYFESEIKFIYISAILVWILKTIFSMGYTAMDTFFLSISLAYVYAFIYNRRKGYL